MVKMYHDDPKATGGPTTADVPKDGVEMMRGAGWYLKEEPGSGETAEAEARTPDKEPSRKKP